MTHLSLRRVNLCFVTVLVMIAFTMMVAFTPAHAHSVLIDADPFEDAQTERAPAQITLTFNEDIVQLGNEMHVAGPDGETISEGDLIVDGTQVIQPLAEVRPKGAYVVTWRVVSADGHPISGEYTFTASADFPAVDDDESTDETTDDASEEPPAQSTDSDETTQGDNDSELTTPQATTQAPETDTDSDADAEAADDANSDTGRSPWRVAILVVVGLGAIGGIIARIVVLRRTRN